MSLDRHEQAPGLLRIERIFFHASQVMLYVRRGSDEADLWLSTGDGALRLSLYSGKTLRNLSPAKGLGLACDFDELEGALAEYASDCTSTNEGEQ